MPRARNALFPLIVIVLLVYLASQTILPNDGDDDTSRIAYGDLLTRVENSPQAIVNVVFIAASQRIEITLADGTALESNYPTESSQLELQHLLQRHGIDFDSTGTADSAWWSILTYLAPFVLFFGFWIFLMRRVQARKSRDDEDRTPGDLRET